jgi:hypothetical protein
MGSGSKSIAPIDCGGEMVTPGPRMAPGPRINFALDEQASLSLQPRTKS